MAWTDIGTIEVRRDWNFTNATESEIFRISHLFPNSETNLRAAVAQGFLENGKANIFNPKIIFRRDEVEIFTFYFPAGISSHSLGIKRLDTTEATWTVKVESWQSNNASENFSNYLISRFGDELMSQIYPRLFSGSTTPSSGSISLKAGNPVKLVSENLGRTELSIRSSGHPVLLATGFDENGVPLAVLEEMPPNYSYVSVATTAGLYKGEIWAVSQEDTKVSYTQYVAQ